MPSLSTRLYITGYSIITQSGGILYSVGLDTFVPPLLASVTTIQIAPKYGAVIPIISNASFGLSLIMRVFYNGTAANISLTLGNTAYYSIFTVVRDGYPGGMPRPVLMASTIPVFKGGSPMITIGDLDSSNASTTDAFIAYPNGIIAFPSPVFATDCFVI